MKKRPIAVFALLCLALVLHAACGLSTAGTGNKPDCQPCTGEAQCASTVCTNASCGADGCCVFDALPDGEAPGESQVPGDCKTVTCSGGVVDETAEDTDVLDDGEECTNDSCQNGEPVHSAKYDPLTSTGEPCANGTGECGPGGDCIIACSATQPCPASDNPCIERTCDVGTGTCIDEPLHGVPVPGRMQVDGDCRFLLCADGAPTDAIDDADLPFDDNDCTSDICNSGRPSNPVLLADTPCPGGNVCDGAGTCVQCNVPSQCFVGDPPDTFCDVRTCINGVCGKSYQPNNTPLPVQNPGDCKTAVCDGSGNTIQSTTGADIPEDNNPCTTDTCTGSTPMNTNLPPSTSCGANSLCDGNGNCVGCLTPLDCPGVDDFCKTRTCVNNVCGYNFTPNNTPFPPAQQNVGDCKERQCDGGGNEKVVANNGDLPVDALECTNDICTMGSPSNPPKADNTQCAQGVCFSGTCVQCNMPGQCTTPPICVTNTCVNHVCGQTPTPVDTPIAMQTAGDCKVVVCNGMNGTKVNPDTGDLPNDNNPCTADSCSAQGNPVFNPVSAGTPCGAGNSCDGMGVCKKNDGQSCMMNAECLNGNCVDAVCCNTTCVGTCVACSAAKKGSGSNGVCGNIANNSDPDNECSTQAQSTCGTDGMCNGNAACRLWASGTVCVAQSCMSGTQQDADTCNGMGTCIDNGTTACTPYTCGASGCKTTCTIDADCVSTHYCMGSTCTMKKANGLMCGGANQCQSGNCADGVCCNVACNALCVACSAAKKGQGSDGTCGNIVDNSDPDNECATQAQSTCGTDGMCNGSGACRLWAAGTVCVASSCQNATTQNDPDTCNGSGTCVDGGTTSCLPLVCSGSGCLMSCSNDNQCSTGFHCDTGMCVADLALGDPCMSDGQCDSGFCEDGFCCEDGCSGLCMACSAALTPSANGQCDFIDEQKDDVSPMCSGNDTCNGAGVCLLANGQPCSGDNQCASNQCNGAGPTCN